MKILVVGGTGGFGQTICRQLDLEGHRVVAVGRTSSSGARLVGQTPRIEFVAIDRDEIDPAFIRRRGIEAVVDASGPFQSREVGLVRAAVFAGVHYIDISDDGPFIDRVASLSAQARAAGIVVVSGASSTPGLSGAVVAQCADGIDVVETIDISITASSQAVFGEAVLKAMLDRAGSPLEDDIDGPGSQMTEFRRITLRTRGVPGMTRGVLRCASPDPAHLSSVYGRQARIRFWAGGETDWQNRSMQLVSWLVRAGVLSSGASVLSPARLARRLSSGTGDGRSGMKVRVVGHADGRRVTSTWTLIAEGGHGPLLPAMGVPAVIAAIANGSVAPGAIRAADVMSVDAVTKRMPRGSIRQEIRSRTADPLYCRIMGPGFGNLHPAVARVHSFGVDRLEGTARVEGASGRLGRLAAALFGFPRSSDEVPVTVVFDRDEEGETWTRTFGDRSFSSRLDRKGNHLRERFGPFRFLFRLEAAGRGLSMLPAGWSLFGIPLPKRLQPDGTATERGIGRDFIFDVPITVPFIGRVAHYRGRLHTDAAGAGLS